MCLERPKRGHFGCKPCWRTALPPEFISSPSHPESSGEEVAGFFSLGLGGAWFLLRSSLNYRMGFSWVVMWQLNLRVASSHPNDIPSIVGKKSCSRAADIFVCVYMYIINTCMSSYIHTHTHRHTRSEVPNPLKRRSFA